MPDVVKVTCLRHTQNTIQIQIGPGDSGLRKNLCAWQSHTIWPDMLCPIQGTFRHEWLHFFTLYLVTLQFLSPKANDASLLLEIWPGDLLCLVEH